MTVKKTRGRRPRRAQRPRPEREQCESLLRERLAGRKHPAQALPEDSRLRKLQKRFNLTEVDVDIVAALWTTAHSPEWRKELAAHDVFAGHLTVLGLTRCLGRLPLVRLPSESALRSWRMVFEQPFVDGTAALTIDPQIIAWLDGEHELDRALVGRAHLLPVSFELPSWNLEDVADETTKGLAKAIRWRVHVATADEISAHACVAALARRLKLLALYVHRETLSSEEAHERAVRVQRQAFLDQCAPCWSSVDAELACPSEIPAFPIQFVVGDQPLQSREGSRDLTITLPEPTVAERRDLWKAALPDAASWKRAALDDLALRVAASPGEILRVAATEPRDAREAALRVQDSAVDDISALARRLPRTFTWDDLVVPEAVRERLEEVAFEADERVRLWAEPEALRLYPQGRGLIVLLAGPPGTGKTMSAQVIANHLGLELLRIDLSQILSKWVGETAQHLQKVLSSAASRRSILLFDEADALMGRRIEDARQAQDHFINMDIGHLMVALESYTGIVLLATNLKSNLDAAFVRRIRHSIEFTLPNATAREAIWARAVEALFGAPLNAAARDAISRVSRIESSGAQIKNAALSAAFAARRGKLDMDAPLLGRMLARELVKDGGGLSGREFASVLEGAA